MGHICHPNAQGTLVRKREEQHCCTLRFVLLHSPNDGMGGSEDLVFGPVSSLRLVRTPSGVWQPKRSQREEPVGASAGLFFPRTRFLDIPALISRHHNQIPVTSSYL